MCYHLFGSSQMPNYYVTVNQTVCVCSCREDAVSYGVIWDKEGTAGINAEEWGEQMQ